MRARVTVELSDDPEEAWEAENQRTQESVWGNQRGVLDQVTQWVNGGDTVVFRLDPRRP